MSNGRSPRCLLWIVHAMTTKIPSPAVSRLQRTSPPPVSYSLCTLSVAAQNLVVKGDFEAGNAGIR